MNWEHGLTVLSGVDVLRKSTVKAENKKGDISQRLKTEGIESENF